MVTLGAKAQTKEVMAQTEAQTMARKIVKESSYGGPGGQVWDDSIECKIQMIGVAKVDIHHSNSVIGLQVTYRLANGETFTGEYHGGKTDCPASSFTLACDERIVRIEGKTDRYLMQISFHTRDGSGQERTYGPYGDGEGRDFFVDGYVLGFHGRSSTSIDALGVYYLPQIRRSPQYGGTGGGEFTDPVEVNIPPVVGIEHIRIRHADRVKRIEADYYLLGGGILDGSNHGGGGGNLTKITLEKGEMVTKMTGKTNSDSGKDYVDQLSFTVRKLDGEVVTYGPYGKGGKNDFEVEGNIIGFFGRSGQLLDAVGVYYCDISQEDVKE